MRGNFVRALGVVIAATVALGGPACGRGGGDTIGSLLGPGTFGDGGSCTSGSDFTGCPCQAGQTMACYTGPPGTEGVGRCKAGTQTCVVSGGDVMGGFGACVGEAVPTAGAACGSKDSGGDGATCVSGSCTQADSGPQPPDAAVDCSQLSCQPQTLATGVVDAFYIALDGTSVYWTDSTALKTVHKDGTGLATLVSGGGPGALAVDATNVYWTTLNLDKIGKLGAGQSTLWSGSSTSPPINVATDGTAVYWSTGGLGSGPVMTVHPDGSGLSALTPTLTSLRGMALDTTHAYFADADTVFQVGKDGSGLQGIAYGQTDVWDLATFQGAVFWSTSDGSTTRLRTIHNANVVDLFTDSLDGGPSMQVRGIAADATGVYFGVYGAGYGNVGRVQWDGSGLTNVAADEPGACAVALDDIYVYWSAVGDSTIKRLPKCCVH